ncbi:hypothetical protein [Psychrobacillus vulpis]|uniref:Uncharacterized protein n=1 Tax=Psychrobacillus vulpis TaxID=2325572 RepID=A0A544TR56_9BACI|nr:hypothetical protein [Psychrobacillus vulpis]TQR19939.1 hypothetical protein FG384_09760 [Psychrobacillus vulpis]
MNFIDFKLQDAATICTDALQSRGFQVKKCNGHIEFLQSSSKNDLVEAVAIINKLAVPCVVKGQNSIEILVNKLPLSFYSKVAKFGGQPYCIPFAMQQTNWRYFHNHRFDVRLDALKLEYNMAAFVKAANLAGIRVVSGCNGHYKNSPRFQVIGEYYGAWFEMIQQLFMHELSLNYQWEVLYQGNTKAEIRAVGNDWDMDRIHQDTLKMAERLQQHAKEIRAIKEQIFVKQATEPKQFVINKQYKQLVQWMMQQYEKKVAFNF